MRVVLRLAGVTFCLVMFAAGAEAQQRGRGGGATGVYKGRITPHWLGGSKFWYQNELGGRKREFILVDAEQGTRAPAFDHERLGAALTEAGDATASADRLPREAIELKPAENAIEFRAGKDWRCDLATYTVTEIKARKLPPAEATPSGPTAQGGFNRFRDFGGATRNRGGRS